MRFLFVYQDYSKQAADLLDQLQITDVTIIVARRHEVQPKREDICKLEANRGAPAAACHIDRKYRKNVSGLVNFTYEPKKFRIDDQQLREWLCPRERPVVEVLSPSEAFARSAKTSPYLVLHRDALVQADFLARHRWSFACESARLLARLADGEQLAPFRQWKASYRVQFALGGGVSFKYHLRLGNRTVSGSTDWHLKEGDNTDVESAARIYFIRTSFDDGLTVVAVFYVGPHPDDGEKTVDFDIS